MFKQESIFHLTAYDTFGFCFFRRLLLGATFAAVWMDSPMFYRGKPRMARTVAPAEMP